MREMQKVKESYIENNYVEFWIEDGIIIEIFKPEVTRINLKMAKEIVADRLKVTNGMTRPLFVDLANVKSADKEAREYFAGAESVYLVSASAFLLHSYVAWLLGKLFLSINKPKANIELFRAKTKAIRWLENYKNLN